MQKEGAHLFYHQIIRFQQNVFNSSDNYKSQLHKIKIDHHVQVPSHQRKRAPQAKNNRPPVKIGGVNPHTNFKPNIAHTA